MRIGLAELVVLFFIIYSLWGCSGMASSSHSVLPPTPFFGGIENSAPKLLGPDLISTKHQELNGTFSRDGQEFYWTMGNPAGGNSTILSTVLGENSWTAPQITPFSGKYSDVDPVLTPKSDRLYFCSNRPLDGSTATKDYDIWFVQRKGTKWSDPINPGAPLNSDRNDFYPSSTLDGRIYFARFDTTRNTDDIFVAIPDGTTYQVNNIGDSVNTLQAEYDPFISPYEDYLLFSSFRNDGLGSSDIYISFREEGHWSSPINLGDRVNSEAQDYCPLITPDQKYFIYTSKVGENAVSEFQDISKLKESYSRVLNGSGNIYWCKADWILEMGN